MSTSFNSEELNLFATILNRACAEMQIHDEATRALVAMRIMHVAQAGQRDPDRLLQYAKRKNGSVAA